MIKDNTKDTDTSIQETLMIKDNAKDNDVYKKP